QFCDRWSVAVGWLSRARSSRVLHQTGALDTPARSEVSVFKFITAPAWVAAATFAGCLAVPHVALATSIIDFSSAAWNGAIGQSSFSVGAVTAGASDLLSKDDHSGLGVDAGIDDRELDEINNFEVLTIIFAGGTSIDQITVSKLFHEGDPAFNEFGFYS